MYSDWGAAARALIAETIAKLDAGADLAARRKALRERATYFHAGTSWGKKVWARECRKHLELHGLPPLKPLEGKVRATDQHRLCAAVERGDIVFPFA